MNDLHIHGIQLLPDESREEAAIGLKSFLNQALQEMSPKLGRLEFVSIPGSNASGMTMFGFAHLIDRRGHPDAIALLNTIEYRGRRLAISSARREPNINSSRAVRDGRRLDGNTSRCGSASQTPQAARSRSQPPAPTIRSTPLGKGRGILVSRKAVTFQEASDSDTEELEEQREVLLAKLARKNARAARRQEIEEELGLRRLQLDRDTEQ